MKSLIKKILKSSLSESTFRKIYEIIIAYRNFIFLSSSYMKKFNFKNFEYENINQDLIIIAQIQRSGGTLLSQLFDSHPEIHSYPSELRLTNPKYDWTEKFNFITFFNDRLLVSSAKKNDYKKDGSGLKKVLNKNEFKFDFFSQKIIFESQKNKNNLRDNLNAYFTSFFNSFKNYNNKTGIKKFIIAFLPRFIFKLENLELFYDIYSNGKIICVIRSPLNWLASAINHSEVYKKDPIEALNLWKKSSLRTIEAKEKFKDKLLIVDFNDLINDTEETMKKLCKNLKLEFHKTLNSPSFNGELIRSNSSFDSTSGKIDKKTLDRKLPDNEISKYSSMLKECNNIKNDVLKYKI